MGQALDSTGTRPPPGGEADGVHRPSPRFRTCLVASAPHRGVAAHKKQKALKPGFSLAIGTKTERQATSLVTHTGLTSGLHAKLHTTPTEA
jgi:hypothetical protein